jgi:hypothetical protein
MDKKLVSTILFMVALFIFSCNEGSKKTVKSQGEAGAASAAHVARVLPAVQQPDSSNFQPGTRYKKKSCCVGAPSRFKKALATK